VLFLGAFWIEIIHYGVILSVLGAFFIVRRSIHQKNRAARHYQRNRLTAEIQRRRRNFFGVFFWITCKSKKKALCECTPACQWMLQHRVALVVFDPPGGPTPPGAPIFPPTPPGAPRGTPKIFRLRRSKKQCIVVLLLLHTFTAPQAKIFRFLECNTVISLHKMTVSNGFAGKSWRIGRDLGWPDPPGGPPGGYPPGGPDFSSDPPGGCNPERSALLLQAAARRAQQELGVSKRWASCNQCYFS